MDCRDSKYRCIDCAEKWAADEEFLKNTSEVEQVNEEKQTGG